MGTATLSTRLVATVLPRWRLPSSSAPFTKPKRWLTSQARCGLCLSLAKVDHALVEVGPPPPVHSLSALNHQPDARVVRATPVRLMRPLPSAIEADSGRLVN